MLIELPRLLPNEHILSVLARWFDGTGRNDFLMTSKRVSTNLSKLNASTIWRPVYSDLISHYADTTGVNKIISEHTLVPYYRPFITKPQYTLLQDAITTGARHKVIPSLQNNVTGVYMWRWCQSCADEDYEEYGVTYWHTYHQIPTMLRCYKHQTALVSMCQSCDFKYMSFQRHWLPPVNGECLECGEIVEVPTVLKSTTSYWLDAVSIALQQKQTDLTLNVLLELMREKLGYQCLPRNIPLALRKEVVEIQKAFEVSLEGSVISTYLTRDQGDIYKRGQKLLNIITTVYRNSQVPPISLLLMLRSLGLEHELTKLLLDSYS